MLGLYLIIAGYVLGQRTPPGHFMDLVVQHHPLNCYMLGNVLGLFPGMGSDAAHGSICIRHLLLRCPIACLRLFYSAHLVSVLLVLVASAEEK